MVVVVVMCGSGGSVEVMVVVVWMSGRGSGVEMFLRTGAF
jgi:hypothetical protein